MFKKKTALEKALKRYDINKHLYGDGAIRYELEYHDYDAGYYHIVKLGEFSTYELAAERAKTHAQSMIVSSKTMKVVL